MHSICEKAIGLLHALVLLQAVFGCVSAFIVNTPEGHNIITWAPPTDDHARSTRSYPSELDDHGFSTRSPLREADAVAFEIEALRTEATTTMPHPRATMKPVDTKHLRVTQDLIFVEQGRTLLNTDIVAVNRDFDLSNLFEMLKNLTSLKDKHGEICSSMTRFLPTNEKFQYFSQRREYNAAKAFCESKGLSLPEVRTFSDRIEMLTLFTKFNFIETHSAAYYSEAKSNVVFPDLSPAINGIGFCGDKPWKTQDLKYHHLYDYYSHPHRNIDRVHSYFLNQHNNVELCWNVHETLPTVCMNSKTESQNSTTLQQIEFCTLRTDEISESLEPLIDTVQLLQDTIDPSAMITPPSVTSSHKNKRSAFHSDPMSNASLFDPVPFFQIKNSTEMQSYRPSKSIRRSKRDTNGGIFLSMLSLILQITGFLRSEAVLSGVATKIGNLEIDMRTVSSEVENLSREVFAALDNIQEQAFLINASQSVYQSYLRILMTLQDSVLSFQNTIQAVQYNMVTQELINSNQLTQINGAVLSQTGSKISMDKSLFQVRPVLSNDRLSVQISIPLADREKEVRLYEVHPFPFFASGVKYHPICNTMYLAIFEHSSAYNLLTSDEYHVCRSQMNFCQAKTPKYLSQIPNCATSQFFNRKDHAQIAHERSPDQAPFFLTADQLTMFAVNEEMELAFDCEHIDKAGPDVVHKLIGRGNFTTPDSCTFSTDLMKYSKPTTLVLDPKASPVSSQFDVNVPTINNFPLSGMKHNINVRNVTARLRARPDQPIVTHSSMLLYVSLAIGGVCLLFIIVFGIFKLYKRVMAFFSCCLPFKSMVPQIHVYQEPGAMYHVSEAGSSARFRAPSYASSTNQVSYLPSCLSSSTARAARAQMRQMEEYAPSMRSFVTNDVGDTVVIEHESEIGPIRKSDVQHQGEFGKQLAQSVDSGYASQAPRMLIDQLHPDLTTNKPLSSQTLKRGQNVYTEPQSRVAKRSLSDEAPTPKKRSPQLVIPDEKNAASPLSAPLLDPSDKKVKFFGDNPFTSPTSGQTSGLNSHLGN